MFKFFNTKKQETSTLDNSHHKITNNRDTIWQSNLVELFDIVDTAYVWQYRLYNEPNKVIDSGFIAISSGCYQITGYTKTEMINAKKNMLLEIIHENDYDKYIKNINEYTINNKSEPIQECYNLKNGKKVMVNVLLHEKTKEYLDFIGLTVDLPHKEQLDLILETSEDMIMIDDGLERLINYINVNNINYETITAKELRNYPEHLIPNILYVSNSYKKFGFIDNPIGKKIIKYVDDKCISTILLEIANNNNNKKLDNILFLVQGKINDIPVEINISKMGDKLLSIVRNITDRIEKFEIEKKLAIQTVARKKDSEANSFIKHEVKNGLFSTQSQIKVLKDMYINAIQTNDVYKQEFHNNIIDKYNEVSFELDTTLQTILSETMAKDIINGEYISKKTRVNLINLISKIKGDRYKWFINPNNLPIILTDELLLFYIIRNAISNANKYGEKHGDIIINININNTILEVSIINMPGDNHDELVKLDNPNIIFDKGVRLHNIVDEKNNKHCSSSGDGAWIIRNCANICGGDCDIMFNSTHTKFTFKCEIEIAFEIEDYKNFIFPENTYIYIIDDSKIQRRFMEKYIKNIQSFNINIITLGNNEDEIENLYDYLFKNINDHKNSKHIIICDENLDYKINGSLKTVSGSSVCEKLKNNIINKNYITFIRSANDSKLDYKLYLEKADAILPKEPLTLYEIKEIILNMWFKHFGYNSNSTIDYNIDTNIKDIICIFLEDIDDFINITPNYYDWNSFWCELHKVKGTLNILNNYTNNTDTISLIESMRTNNFDSDFDNLWYGLCENLKQIKQNVIELI